MELSSELTCHGEAMSRRELLRAALAVASSAAAVSCVGRRPVAVDDIDRLARSLRGRILQAGSPGYDEARRVWNTAVDRRPLLMARCADVEDVRRCVSFARQHGTSIAVRGGGHSFAGHGVADGAVQVDLAELHAVTVDAAERRASVGGGARIKELLEPALRAGLYTPMGGCGDVGVAGLALAGGDTFAMGMHGTACDNLLSAQIVTADGSVLEVGPGSHEDLFWALRGGGGNFGIVTRLDFQLHPVRPTTSGYWEIPLKSAAGATRAVRELLEVAPDEVGAGFGLGPQSSAWVSCGILGEGIDAERTLAAWRAALRPVEPRTRTSLPDAKGVVLPPGARAAAAVFVNEMSDGLIDALVELAGRAPRDAYIYAAASRGAVARVPVGDTAYPLRRPGFHLSAEAPWTQVTDRVAAEEWTAGFETAVRPFGRLAYVNYLGAASVDQVRDAYGPNYERLARIKGRYDPANLFRSNHNILPAR